jgi:hypothetical protein
VDAWSPRRLSPRFSVQPGTATRTSQPQKTAARPSVTVRRSGSRCPVGRSAGLTMMCAAKQLGDHGRRPRRAGSTHPARRRNRRPSVPIRYRQHAPLEPVARPAPDMLSSLIVPSVIRFQKSRLGKLINDRRLCQQLFSAERDGTISSGRAHNPKLISGPASAWQARPAPAISGTPATATVRRSRATRPQRRWATRLLARSWDVLSRKIARIGYWEFEDYPPEPIEPHITGSGDP